jgi:hypothetical protein
MACSSATAHEKAYATSKIYPVTVLTISFRCMFWNSEYNALASLPTLFDVFLRDTQRVRAHPCTQSAAAARLPLSLFLVSIHFMFFAVGCSSGRQPPHQQRAAACKFTRGQAAQVSRCVALHPSCLSRPYITVVYVVLMRSCSAFSSPDIAAVGEVGAVRRLLAHMQPR